MNVLSVGYRHSYPVILVVLICLCSIFAQAAGDKIAPVKPATQAGADAPAVKPARINKSLDNALAPLEYLRPARFRGHRGQQMEVSLLLLLTERVAHMRVQAAAEKPLLLTDSSAERIFTDLPAGERVLLQYTVQPQAEGLSYVNVVISLQTENGLRMSSYSIPVEVGDVAAAVARKPRPEIVLDDDGVALQIMRVRQSESAEPR